MRRSSYGSGGVSNSWAMPLAASTSISSVRRTVRGERERQGGGDRRLAGAALARDHVQPRPRQRGRATRMSPPLKVTSTGSGVGCGRRLQLSAMSSPATPGTTWEYLTAPVLIHNTQAILNNFGATAGSW
jgi:hypothetical protein